MTLPHTDPTRLAVTEAINALVDKFAAAGRGQALSADDLRKEHQVLSDSLNSGGNVNPQYLRDMYEFVDHHTQTAAHDAKLEPLARRALVLFARSPDYMMDNPEAFEALFDPKTSKEQIVASGQPRWMFTRRPIAATFLDTMTLSQQPDESFQVQYTDGSTHNKIHNLVQSLVLLPYHVARQDYRKIDSVISGLRLSTREPDETLFIQNLALDLSHRGDTKTGKTPSEGLEDAVYAAIAAHDLPTEAQRIAVYKAACKEHLSKDDAAAVRISVPKNEIEDVITQAALVTHQQLTALETFKSELDTTHKPTISAFVDAFESNTPGALLTAYETLLLDPRNDIPRSPEFNTSFLKIAADALGDEAEDKGYEGLREEINDLLFRGPTLGSDDLRADQRALADYLNGVEKGDWREDLSRTLTHAAGPAFLLSTGITGFGPSPLVGGITAAGIFSTAAAAGAFGQENRGRKTAMALVFSLASGLSAPSLYPDKPLELMPEAKAPVEIKEDPAIIQQREETAAWVRKIAPG